MPSRRCRRPVTASTSPLVSSTAAIGLERRPWRRMEDRAGLDLLPQVGRGVDQCPAQAVGRERDAGLGGRAGGGITGTSAAAGLAVGVPLREAAAGRGAEHTYEHGIRDRQTAAATFGLRAQAQAWAGRYMVTSMLTGVVWTFGACHTFFCMISLPCRGPCQQSCRLHLHVGKPARSDDLWLA